MQIIASECPLIEALPFARIVSNKRANDDAAARNRKSDCVDVALW
jgi:hypothetical protein